MQRRRSCANRYARRSSRSRQKPGDEGAERLVLYRKKAPERGTPPLRIRSKGGTSATDGARGYRRAFRHPAARASDSEQNQRSPFEVLIRVWLYD